MEKTALQELIDYIKDDPWNNKGKGDILQKAVSLIDKEKKNILDAWKSGKRSDYCDTSDKYIREIYNNL